ncbi:probable ADP-ribosylation factor GTPase-activating protein AGD14 isoform X2 [Chenopodium quinoa]|uniref:probable ADP-ribosylation factor GTPase-activating protein AGD14 isoform X1 n=1 Tax=Chenopodium quinoa TaxID=63459 RepID=UPI000B78793D|nr:probable ADP-ribosylation factor GTPase-activating protein AGD14 isoform X1 [Chenopodium quinoa]XP_021723681.1 probable ADP-ribosylation factor GTPase-activating protein AGD14 isoform X2 [Chenopodium quinoa]
MANRKEDEKNEKIIRGLLKQPGNRKCINCNTLGPQYVCITFSTFVCTTCGGIHREFTHRVKSVSMAKFTPQEIAALQAGGNERAKEIHFKEWDTQRQTAPDSSNVDRLRDFIKHVYVDRRYSGERGSDRPPRGKLGDKEEPNENRRSDAYQSGSRSPPYDDRYERRSSGRSSPGYDARSPGYDQDNQRHSDYGRSPVRPGIINNWRREDRFSNGRKSDDRHSSDGEGKPEIKSSDSQKDSVVPSLPVVRLVGEILGDNVVPLRISEPPRANSGRVVDGPKITQRTASSSSLASSNGNPVEPKKETSLIDFDAEPEPPVTAAATQAQLSTADQSVVQPTSTQNDNDWACFDSAPVDKVSQAPQSTNPLDSLTLLSVPIPGHSSGSTSSNAAPMPSNGVFPSSTSGDLLFASVGSTPTDAFPGAAPASSPLTTLSSFPSGGAVAGSNLPPTLPSNGGNYQQYGIQHQQQAFTHNAGGQPAAAQLASGFPNGFSSQGVAGNRAAQPSQVIATLQSQTVEVKPNDRRELPADLFTATYSFAPYQAPGWRPGVSGMYPGMQYPMQYNPAMSMPTFPQPTFPQQTFPQPNKSSNPFDAEGSSGQPAAFPSMSTLHAALPNAAAPGGVVHPSNIGTAMPYGSAMPGANSIPPQTSTVHPAAPSLGSAMPGGTYMGQQLPPNMASSRPQGFGSFGNEVPAFASLNPAAAMPNPSLGGNPFG